MDSNSGVVKYHCYTWSICVVFCLPVSHYSTYRCDPTELSVELNFFYLNGVFVAVVQSVHVLSAVTFGTVFLQS